MSYGSAMIFGIGLDGSMDESILFEYRFKFAQSRMIYRNFQKEKMCSCRFCGIAWQLSKGHSNMERYD
ncbi:hypothetical protein Anas_12478 [Armadillidium nasatum]|uniref:Uncharacterized protein n=1 Tax=Armadillidium nasatum TaxID=96803 RepID=A0A5N5SQ64_9CRUS|nr:hypothetical protein Anas_12478 [Armadillidium nasatum]